MMRILLPLDGSTAAEESIRHALSIARVFPAQLILLRAVEETGGGATSQADSMDLALCRHQARAYLNGLCQQYEQADIDFRCEVVEGNAAEAIVDFMATTKPDLLVLTRYGLGDAREFSAGGTVQKVVTRAACSVLLLDPAHAHESADHYRRIMVPIDDSKESDCAVAVATMIAEIHGSSLLLLQVTDEPHLPAGVPTTSQTQTLLNGLTRVIRLAAHDRLRELANKIPATVSVETHVLISADAPLAIEEAARTHGCDLLVLHTRDASDDGGRGLGPVNLALIQFSHCPVFVLRPAVAGAFTSNFRSVYLDECQLDAG